ncbi:MAG: hypothetical protein KKE20_03795, partial [Nanoarchaeota archaeon]|nr:hypothetical protein [Nanoarchaeota archaeon]
AYLSAFITKDLFVPVFLIAYLLTNVAGLLLMQHGAAKFSKKIPRLSLIENAAVSVFYMIIIISLMLLDIVPIPKQT